MKRTIPLILLSLIVIASLLITGCTGDIGATGTQGKQGITGEQGSKGDTGSRGLPGLAGLQGIQGEKGAFGARGLQGFEGEKGDTGDAGIAGEQGIAGVQGPPGMGGAGATGLTGVTGAPGFPPPPSFEVNLNPKGVASVDMDATKSNTFIWSAYLKTNGTAGAGDGTAEIILTPLVPMMLGQFISMQWQEYLVAGYPPHIDVRLDTDGDGLVDEALVFEYAYNSPSHYAEVHTATEAFGALTGVWYAVFSDDAGGPAVINDLAFAWMATGAPGPYPPTGGAFVCDTLANWKAGVVIGGASVDATAVVITIHLEIDNWIKVTEAYVDDIVINGVPVYWIP